MGRGSAARGISPVIGVSLLLVIVVAMAVLTGALFLDFGSRLTDTPPLFAEQGHVELQVSNGTVTGQDLVLVHEGGGAVDVSKLRIRIDTGNGTFETVPNATEMVADGTWSVGDRLSVELDPDQVCTGRDQLEVDVVYGEERSYPVASTTVPVVAGGFTIQNGVVVPVSEYTAEATVLGTGFTSGGGGPRIDVRLDVQIGNQRFDPWPGNVNNEGNPRSESFADLPAGAGIAIGATADQNGVYIQPRTRWSNESSGWVHVLRDGDTPPNVGGFGDQDSAAAYVAPYLAPDGTIDLTDNQAIYLFELGNSQTGSAADYQDVVVLVSLTTEQQTSVQQLASGEAAVVCPAGS